MSPPGERMLIKGWRGRSHILRLQEAPCGTSGRVSSGHGCSKPGGRRTPPRSPWPPAPSGPRLAHQRQAAPQSA
eukprot:9166526-Pyramimonas_sp.AAC.1